MWVAPIFFLVAAALAIFDFVGILFHRQCWARACLAVSPRQSATALCRRHPGQGLSCAEIGQHQAIPIQAGGAAAPARQDSNACAGGEHVVSDSDAALLVADDLEDKRFARARRL